MCLFISGNFQALLTGFQAIRCHVNGQNGLISYIIHFIDPNFVKVTVDCGISHKNTKYKQLVMLPLSMPLKHIGVVEVYAHIFLTLALDGGERSASLPSCFAPGEELPIPIE